MPHTLELHQSIFFAITASTWRVGATDVAAAGPCNDVATALNARLGGNAFSCFDLNATGLLYLVVAAAECAAKISALNVAMPLTPLVPATPTSSPPNVPPTARPTGGEGPLRYVKDDFEKLSAADDVGIGIGIFVVLLIGCVLACFCCQKDRRSDGADTYDDSGEQHELLLMD